MKLSTLTAQRENLKIEIAANVKSLANEIRAGKITRAEADKKIGELRSIKNQLDKKIALFNKPKGDEKRSGGARLTNADFIKAAEEKRSLTLAGNGAVNQIKEIIKAIVNDDSLLNEFRYYYGANSETNIPVLSPRPAVPAGQQRIHQLPLPAAKRRMPEIFSQYLQRRIRRHSRPSAFCFLLL